MSQMNEIAALKAEEKARLDAVYANVKSEMARVRPDYDQFDVLRFVVARKFDVNAATEMLMNHFKWNETFNVKAVVEEVQTIINTDIDSRSYFPHCYDAPYGVDKNGDPYFYERHGSWDIKGLMKKIDEPSFVKYSVWRMECCLKSKREASERLGRPVVRNYTLLDLNGLNHGFLNIKFIDMLKISTQIEADNYPEMLKAVYIFNCPNIFPTLYAIIKPFIDANTISKVRIFGFNNYKQPLSEIIDASQLPIEVGGSNGNPWRNVNNTDVDSGSVTVALKSSSKFIVPVEVTEKDTKIYWDFNTDANDLAFGVVFGGKEVVPITRFSDPIEPVQGYYLCKEIGKYEVVFDNSFAMFRSKNVRYRLDAIAPSNVEMEKIND